MSTLARPIPRSSATAYWADVKQLLIDMQMLITSVGAPNTRALTLQPATVPPDYRYWAFPLSVPAGGCSRPRNDASAGRWQSEACLYFEVVDP
jgi:hypothetical protein